MTQERYRGIPTRKNQAPQTNFQLEGFWLYLARGAWIAFMLAELVIILLTLFESLRYGLTICPWSATSCFVTPATVHALHQVGIASSSYANYNLVLTLLQALILLVVGGLLFWSKPSEPLCLAASFVFVTIGLWPFFTSSTYPPAVAFAHISATYILPLAGYFLVTFPNGRFVPRWSWLLVVLWVVQTIVFQLPGPFNILSWPPPLFAAELLLTYGGTIGVQIYRYVRVSSYSQCQQTKWLVFGFGGLLVFFILYSIIGSLVPELAAPDSLYQLAGGTFTTITILFVPLSVAIAILRYRLYDIDIIIRRTMVYGMLTVCVVALYVLVVVGLGALLQTKGNLGLSLLATGLIAVLIQPLHTRLQRAVNHLLYGERDEPYKVISRLGQRLETTLAPEAVLPTIVETVTGALKLPYAAISLKQDGEDVTAASSGQASDELTRLPLVYQSEHIGDLLLAPRARGEAFSSADRVLLADLARQAGIAVHAVRLTMDLQHLTKELQQSRTELVTAREEERRRLRRDLHDGLGSVLASLNWRAGALRMVLFRDPVVADALVVEQQNTIQAAIGDIRRLVYDLRPPALDELGLIGAIRERAAKQSAPTERDSVLGLRVEVVAPDHLPALPAAVEVAAYRIVQEALANVVRHAQAHRCCICLSCENDLLHVEVIDDGIGLPERYRAGIGLLSMRERAAELGGTCEIEPMPEGGTCVRACLPILKNDQQR